MSTNYFHGVSSAAVQTTSSYQTLASRELIEPNHKQAVPLTNVSWIGNTIELEAHDLGRVALGTINLC